MLPKFAYAGQDIGGSCLWIGDNANRPRIKAIKNDHEYCNSKVKLLNDKEESINPNQVHFQIKDVSATCTYICFLHGLYETRTVSVVG